MNAKKLTSMNDHCENCGGALYYSPDHKSLFCESCQSKYEVINDDTIEKHDVHNTDEKSNEYNNWIKENKIFKCKNCGAEIILNSLEISKKCQYCGSSYVAETKELPGLLPDAVVPFQFEEEKAGQYFIQNAKKYFWAPRKFKKSLPESEIYSFYFPAFIFDANSNSSYNGRLATCHRDSNGNTSTTYQNINGSYNMLHRDYIIESSNKLTQNQLRALFPFNLSLALPFKNEYVFGWAVDYYSDGMKKSYADAINQMKNSIRNGILKLYSYDFVDFLNIDSNFSNEFYRYYIMPVYNFKFEYKNKEYNVLMNGENGKLGGGLPVSKLKVFLTISIILIIIAIITILVMTNSINT